MSQVTKYRCDHCLKEVEDPYLEDGWIKVSGSITRSWGLRRQNNRGDAQTDYLGKDKEYCNVECLVAAFDVMRRAKKGPSVEASGGKTAYDHLNEEGV